MGDRRGAMARWRRGRAESTKGHGKGWAPVPTNFPRFLRGNLFHKDSKLHEKRKKKKKKKKNLAQDARWLI